MPLQATSGAASYDAFGGGVPVVPKYIEEYFSTFLYSGTGSAQTITNNIDLSTKGGLVWIKERTSTSAHIWTDTARGIYNYISSDSNNAQTDNVSTLTAFNSNGFSVGGSGATSESGQTYTSWSFAKAPKFFDVVTWTGNGVQGRAIPHNLGSVPGCIIVKRTNASASWYVYHRAVDATSPQNYVLLLDQTLARISSSDPWDNTAPTSTNFTVGSNSNYNGSGDTYVAYLFAHDAGGFGLTGTDNVISCGSFTIDGSGKFTANIGYEPQWIMIKLVNGTSNWSIFDNMRGMPVGSPTTRLLPNTSDAESSAFSFVDINATGFAAGTGSGNPYSEGQTFIYIAIRRGPMKVPTSGTSVFAPVLNTGTGANTNISSGGFAPDMLWNKIRTLAYGTETWDKLRGVRAVGLTTSSTGAEGLSPVGYDLVSFDNTGVTEGANSGSVMNVSPYTYVNYMFGRAPSFFDEVCYTGTGSAVQTYSHNLGVAPELMIVKCRNDAGRNWTVYSSALGNGFRITLNQDLQAFSTTVWNSTSPTATQFTVTSDPMVGANTFTYVAYLFATCAGVQYINSYVGDGTTGRTINCGFTGGARFVCIKATSTSGSWWTFDSARGIVTNSDPALQLNSTAAEVTSADAIDTASSGFIVNQEATCSLNASGVSYLVWAIA